MKKKTFLASMLAAMSACMMVSCYGNDDNEQTVPQASVEESSENVLLVSSNVEATFTFDGQTQTGTEAEFETTKTTGIITVTADGCLPQEAEVNFSEDGAALLEFTMVPASSNQLSQSEAKGKTVENDNANKQTIGVTAAIEVPSNVGISQNTTSPFSVTAYQPAGATANEDISVAQKINSPVMVLNCTPDGAVFDVPVKVSLEIDDADGCEFVCPTSVDGKSFIANGKKLTAEVKHFSEAEFNMVATFTPVGDVVTRASSRAFIDSPLVEESNENPVIPLSTGTLNVDVLQATGFESDVNPNGAKANCLKSAFGNTGYTAKGHQINSNNNGYARLAVTQQQQTYNVQSGSQRFSAVAYQKAEMAVEKTASNTPTKKLHNGGGTAETPVNEAVNELLVTGQAATLPTDIAVPVACAVDAAAKQSDIKEMARAYDVAVVAVPAVATEIEQAKSIPLKKITLADTKKEGKAAILKYNRWYKVVYNDKKAKTLVLPWRYDKAELAKMFKAVYGVRVNATDL